jgi:hypothetical protein
MRVERFTLLSACFPRLPDIMLKPVYGVDYDLSREASTILLGGATPPSIVIRVG